VAVIGKRIATSLISDRPIPPTRDLFEFPSDMGNIECPPEKTDFVKRLEGEMDRIPLGARRWIYVDFWPLQLDGIVTVCLEHV
jgi:hypothetical protein